VCSTVYHKNHDDQKYSLHLQVLQDVTGDEFVVFMKVLSNLKICGTVQGRQQLVDIIADQLDLDQEFSPQDTDSVDRLIQCGKQALPLFSVCIAVLATKKNFRKKPEGWVKMYL
jgi:hypothetical protein